MKRKALGKGIEAIISNQPVQENSNNFLEINVDEIHPNPYQPRKIFAPEKIYELAESIKESGLIQPVVVFRKENKFYLLVGERRWRAVQHLKWSKIPAIVKEFSDEDILVSALIENIQREDLNAIEVAEGIDLLIKKHGLTQENASQRLGMNRSTVTNYLRLMTLPEAVKKSVILGEISQAHARTLLSLEEYNDIIECYFKILKSKLSVRQTEALVKDFKRVNHKKNNLIDPDIQKMEDRLSKYLSTKVTLKYSLKGIGKIEIHFNQIEEFQRLYNIFFKES